MRRKTILMIVALIGLSGFVVLGSSPGLVENLLETIKADSIAKVIYIPVTGSKASEVWCL